MSSTPNGKHESAADNHCGRPAKPARTQHDETFSTAICLGCLFLFYGAFSLLALRIVDVPRSTCREETANPELFSEGRAMKHVQMLAGEIGFRQEGSKGLGQAADYLRDQILRITQRASEKIRIEVDESSVSGSFNLFFLDENFTMAYADLPNIVVRVSAPNASLETEAAVMVNSHFDSAPGTSGAADCAACTAIMLETLRQIVDSSFVPAKPFIFLFNGGEEVYLKAAHGFLTSHPWSKTIGAFLNLEATGTDLPNLVIQVAGRDGWPMRVYSKVALHPAASVISQDVFPLVPGDTDFRIFSSDYGDIPGLDSALLLNAYAYHTHLDRPEALKCGTVQTWGESTLPLLAALAEAPELRTRAERVAEREAEEEGEARGGAARGTPVFFDIFGMAMVMYSQETEAALRSALAGLLIIALFFSQPTSSHQSSLAERTFLVAKGGLQAAASSLLCLLLPAVISAATVAAVGPHMGWFSHPFLALGAFAPAAAAGLLLPFLRTGTGGLDGWSAENIWVSRLKKEDGNGFHSSSRSGENDLDEDKANEGSISEWSAHWGNVWFNLLVCSAISAAGGGSGYLFFWWAVFMLPAQFLRSRFRRSFGKEFDYVPHLCLAAIPAAYCCVFWRVFFSFVAQKLGGSGTHPLPFGPFLPDVAISIVAGALVTCVAAPIVPAFSRRFATTRTVSLLLLLSLAASLALSLRFPYTAEAPKRIILQQVFFTDGEGKISEAKLSLATGDAHDATFLLKHIPSLETRALQLSSHASAEGLHVCGPIVHLTWFPLTDLLGRPLCTSTDVPSRLNEGTFTFPFVRVVNESRFTSPGIEWHRRVVLEVHPGSVSGVWATVLRLQGSLTAWSLSGGLFPESKSARIKLASHVVHFAGGSIDKPFSFWIETKASERITVEFGVLSGIVDKDLQGILEVFPRWVAMASSSSYLSNYTV